MRRVVVSGAFDDIRSRDIRFLEEAAKFESVTVRLSPNAALGAPKFLFGERAYILQAIRFVDAAQAADAVQAESPGADFVERERDATAAHERIATFLRSFWMARRVSWPTNTTSTASPIAYAGSPGIRRNGSQC